MQRLKVQTRRYTAAQRTLFEDVVRKFTDLSRTEFKHTAPFRAGEGIEPFEYYPLPASVCSTLWSFHACQEKQQEITSKSNLK